MTLNRCSDVMLAIIQLIYVRVHNGFSLLLCACECWMANWVCVKSAIGLYQHSAAMATVIKLIGWNVSISLPNSWDWNSRRFSAPSSSHPPSALGLDDDTCGWGRAAAASWKPRERKGGKRGYQRANKTDIIRAPSSCDFPSIIGN